MENLDSNPLSETNQSEDSLVALTFEETRVLGSPDRERAYHATEYYLLHKTHSFLFAIKNNRLPKSNLDEEQIAKTIEDLRIKRLVHRLI